MICVVKADSEEEAKKVVCEKNGKMYNEELKIRTEITAIKVDCKEGYFQYNLQED